MNPCVRRKATLSLSASSVHSNSPVLNRVRSGGQDRPSWTQNPERSDGPTYSSRRVDATVVFPVPRGCNRRPLAALGVLGQTVCVRMVGQTRPSRTHYPPGGPLDTVRRQRVSSRLAFGAVAQLEERRVRNAEVRGSSPLCSTSEAADHSDLRLSSFWGTHTSARRTIRMFAGWIPTTKSSYDRTISRYFV